MKKTPRYFVFTGTDRSIRMVGKSTVTSKAEAVKRAEAYLAKHPNAAVMVSTLKRARVWNRSAAKRK